MKFWIKSSLQEAGWAPLVVLALSVVLGNIFHIYMLVPGIDKLFHLFGGMAITHFFAVCIRRSQKLFGTIQRDRQLLVAVMLSFLVVLAWEGMELLGDQTLNSKLNHGFTDTLLDILFGLLGGLIILFFRAGKPSANMAPDDRKSQVH
ncbi:MAG: hypothetical protein ACO1NO_07355 [Burkholderiaceae bacterium]